MQSRAKQQHTASGKFLSYIKLKTTACHHAFFIEQRQKIKSVHHPKNKEKKGRKKPLKADKKRAKKKTKKPPPNQPKKQAPTHRKRRG